MSEPRYRLAVFDFDGTLADSFPWFLGVFNQVAERYRFRRVDAAEAEAMRGMDARAIVRRLGVPAWKLPLIARHMRALAARDAAGIPLFPGAADALRHLHDRGVTLGILTSNAEGNVRRILGPETAGLVRHYACGAGLFGKRRKLRRLLLTAGVRAAETICIGDEIRDLEAARAEGVAFGAVSWGYATPAALAALGPEEMFATVEDMLAKLG